MTLGFADALRYLYPRTAGGIKWSLGPTGALLGRLGHPEQHFRSIHIGGTNGKGSVAVLIYQVLRAAGVRTALYTSPHLVDVRERMIVDGRPISKAAFAAWTSELRPAIDEVGASFFEATTAIAFADFTARGSEVAVVEVGLGGRLDSTNVIQPMVSGVSHVSREHTDYLGDSLVGIAREKAGIAKPGVPFVIGETDPLLVSVMCEVAAAAGAVVTVVPPEARYGGALGLMGSHQRRNAAVAEALLAALPTPLRPEEDALHRGFAVARLPGRLDLRGRWIFDVAHNAAGVAVLVQALAEVAPRRPLHALVGILRDKDWMTMLTCLLAVVDELWITQPPSAPAERRWDLQVVSQAASGPFRVEEDFDRALAAVQREAGTILVTGSFHTVGDAMARLPGFAPLG